MKSTDTSNEAQLVAFVRVSDEAEIEKHILFCKSLEEMYLEEQFIK
jgi:hypothetical protein